MDKEKITISKAREGYAIEIANLKKICSHSFKIDESCGCPTSNLLKNMYWWRMDLKKEVDIYGVKYNTILLMPYTFCFSKEDLDPEKVSKPIELEKYEKEDEIEEKLPNKNKEKYWKGKINSKKYNTNIDITTGNIHPYYALKEVIRGKHIKQIVLTRNTLKSGKHYGVLYNKEALEKDKKNFITLLKEKDEKIYIPKKCIKIIENDNDEKSSAEYALIEFFGSIGLAKESLWSLILFLKERTPEYIIKYFKKSFNDYINKMDGHNSVMPVLEFLKKSFDDLEDTEKIDEIFKKAIKMLEDIK